MPPKSNAKAGTSGIINGVKKVTLDSKTARRADADASEESSEEDDSSEVDSSDESDAAPARAGASNAAAKKTSSKSAKPAQVGMLCELKNFYSGKEDKRGKFLWRDTIPDDIGEPVENEETAKYALLVRNVKVYNDPRKVLAVHSIVVQSPLLKKVLQRVLSGYPGISPNLKRLELGGKFEPLIHRWSQLEEEIADLDEDTDEDRETKSHAKLFFDVVQSEFKDVIENSKDMISKGVITYELLWCLFAPGAIFYAKQDGQDTALKLSSTRYGTNSHGQPVFWVQGRYVDWDGSRFGIAKLNIQVPHFSGTRKISTLAALPLDFHPDGEGIKKKLVERGAKWEGLAGAHYRSYDGYGWKRSMFGGRDKYNIKGRIVIDAYGWGRFNPNFCIYLQPLNQKERRNGNDSEFDSDDEASIDYEDEINDDAIGMPMDGSFADDDDEANKITLTEEQRLITTPLIRAYALKNKLWLNMYVDCVSDIQFSTGAFDRLVLPHQQKELILGFTESQKAYKEHFDDVIEGKGRGIILLLSGPPGVGKTLTAESVAEEMKTPLYLLSAGDLGLDPRTIENTLKDTLELCSRWNGILLLDEADVFLESRSLHELERNKLVTIFLRVLEYYEGIMFLTTNRVSSFDPAFQSRIHISLDYPELTTESRRMIWKNFIEASPMTCKITERQLDTLSLTNLNGRQVKNVLKTAQLLARRKKTDNTLSFEHIKTVMDVTQHLHNESQESERARSSIFC